MCTNSSGEAEEEEALDLTPQALCFISHNLVRSVVRSYGVNLEPVFYLIRGDWLVLVVIDLMTRFDMPFWHSIAKM